ncbi:MAG TPA: NRDE family protein [Burkholderiales bacterium]
MCLILIAHRADPRYPLVVVANRDEFLRRPSASAGYWPDAPHVLGGRDLEKGGGWLAITTDGRWAAVTNFRDGQAPAPGARSRGALVADYVRGPVRAQPYVQSLDPVMREFHGFNLLAGDGTSVHYLSNRDEGTMQLAPGFYGLSNHHLDTPWPKVARGKRGLRSALARDTGPDRLIESLLDLLADRTLADADALPSTGVSMEWERILSAAFICAPDYGTRASTVLLVDAEGEVHFRERSFGEGGQLVEDRRYRFTLSRDAIPAAG